MKYHPEKRAQEARLAEIMRADATVWRERRAAQETLLAREPVEVHDSPVRVARSISPFEPSLNGYSIGRR